MILTGRFKNLLEQKPENNEYIPERRGEKTDAVFYFMAGLL